jgi:hypothetical protein
MIGDNSRINSFLNLLFNEILVSGVVVSFVNELVVVVFRYKPWTFYLINDCGCSVL